MMGEPALLDMPQPMSSLSSSSKGLNLFYDYSSSASSSIITPPGTAGSSRSRNVGPQLPLLNPRDPSQIQPQTAPVLPAPGPVRPDDKHAHHRDPSDPPQYENAVTATGNNKDVKAPRADGAMYAAMASVDGRGGHHAHNGHTNYHPHGKTSPPPSSTLLRSQSQHIGLKRKPLGGSTLLRRHPSMGATTPTSPTAGLVLQKKPSTSSLRKATLALKARDLGLISPTHTNGDGAIPDHHANVLYQHHNYPVHRSLSVDSRQMVMMKGESAINPLMIPTFHPYTGHGLDSPHGSSPSPAKTSRTETPTSATAVNLTSRLSFKRLEGIRRSNSSPARNVEGGRMGVGASLRRVVAAAASSPLSTPMSAPAMGGLSRTGSSRRRPPMTQPAPGPGGSGPGLMFPGGQYTGTGALPSGPPQFQRAPTPPYGLNGLLGAVAGGRGPPSINTISQSTTTWTGTSSPTTATSAYIPPATRGQIVARLGGILLYLIGWAIAVVGTIIAWVHDVNEAPQSAVYSAFLLAGAVVLVLWMISSTVNGRFHTWRLAFIGLAAVQTSLTVSEMVGWILLAVRGLGHGKVESALGFTMLTAGTIALVLVAGYQPPFRSSLYSYNSYPRYRTYNSHSTTPDNMTLQGPSPQVFPTLATQPRPHPMPVSATTSAVPSPAIIPESSGAAVPLPPQTQIGGYLSPAPDLSRGLSARSRNAPAESSSHPPASAGPSAHSSAMPRDNSNPFATALTRQSTVRSGRRTSAPLEGAPSPEPSPIEPNFQSQLPYASADIATEEFAHLTSGVPSPHSSSKYTSRTPTSAVAGPSPSNPDLFRSKSGQTHTTTASSGIVFQGQVPAYEWQLQNPSHLNESAQASITNPFTPGAASSDSVPIFAAAQQGVMPSPTSTDGHAFAEASPQVMPEMAMGEGATLMVGAHGARRLSPMPGGRPPDPPPGG